MRKVRKRRKIRNLVFEGGGVKGIAYGGALKTMNEMGLLDEVLRVAGTSAGAITATLLALGCSVPVITNIIQHTNFSEFEDDSLGVIRDTSRLITDYGWYKGDAFEKWMGDLIREIKGDEYLTFRGLHKLVSEDVDYPACKDLYIVGTNLTKMQKEIYSYETTPDMFIRDAVRISMSIPFYFACVKRDGDILVDGGVAHNYPIQIFDDVKYSERWNPREEDDIPTPMVNRQTIGFRLDTKEEIFMNAKGWKATGTHHVDGLLEYSSALINFLMEVANKKHLKKSDWKRTIFIDTGDVRTTDFNLSEEKINMLIANGEKAVKNFFP
jgi:NTE family protein